MNLTQIYKEGERLLGDEIMMSYKGIISDKQIEATTKWFEKKYKDQHLLFIEGLEKEIEGMKYTEEQGMDAEMESANGALEKILSSLQQHKESLK